MQLMLMIWIHAMGMVVPFVLQNGGVTSSPSLSDKSYQDIIALLVDEKNERSRFEATVLDRLNNMDDLHHQVSVQLDKDKNSREYMMRRLTNFEQQIRNLTNAADLQKNAIMSNIESQLQNLTDVRNVLENYRLPIIERQLQSLTNAGISLKDKLENYTKTIENRTRMDRLEMMNSLSNYTAKTANTISRLDQQIGFNVASPIKTQHMQESLKFSIVHYNIGGMYNNATGVVTIPVPGLYFLTGTIVREPGITEAYCCLQVNRGWDVNTCTVGHPSSTSGYGSGTMSLLYHFNAGDTVILHDCAGIDYMFESSSFTGYLVQADI